MSDDGNSKSNDCCPECGGAVVVGSTDQFGDAQCPNCGEPLFFYRVGRVANFLRNPEGARVQERFVNVIAVVAARLGVDAASITPNVSFSQDLGADSLDVVELVMELEEEFDSP